VRCSAVLLLNTGRIFTSCRRFGRWNRILPIFDDLFSHWLADIYVYIVFLFIFCCVNNQDVNVLIVLL